MTMTMMFINNTRIAIAKRKGTKSQRLNCTQAATIALFRQAQLYNPISSEQKTNLRAYCDDETRLWRSRGRISNSSLSFDANNPVILPRQSWITKLYILHVHAEHKHTGTSQTLTILRQLVWIPQRRAEVRGVIKKFCFYCRREKAAPFQLPPFLDHPQERVKQPTFPFCNSAVDYLGPFNVKNHPCTTKVWITLFTCLNTRAIYVDIASSLSAICFLQILRRFIATNGTPRWLLSDNVPAFVTVSNAMSSLTRREEQDVIDYCATHNIRFKFVAALAPRQGGVYERMIGIFKTSFKAAATHICVQRYRFWFPTQTYRFFAPTFHNRITTPSDRRPRRRRVETTGDTTRSFTGPMELYNHAAKPLLATMARRIPDKSTRKLPTRASTTALSESPFEDQTVLVHDSTRPREEWKLGRIMNHSDHSATVKLPNGNTITRPLNLLYPLEIPPSKTAQATSPDATQTKATNDSRDIQRETTGKARTHPMILRSLARQLYITILATASIISIVSADFTAYNPPNTKCDKYQFSPNT